MINVRISGFATPQAVASRAPQRSPLSFWMLFALEASFIAGVLALVLALVLPARAPLARSADFATIRDAVWARVNGTINDPLIGYCARHQRARQQRARLCAEWPGLLLLL